MCKFTVPYPPRELNPNFKSHWGTKSKKVKQYRFDCYVLGKRNKPTIVPDKPIHISLTFHPRTAHKVDADNALSSFKAGFDGLADAWKVNDHRFIPLIAIGEPVKGGAVDVEVLQ